MFMTSNQLHAVHEVTSSGRWFVDVFSSGENISKIIWENGVVLILSRFRLCLCVQKLSHISPLFHGTEQCHFKKRRKGDLSPFNLGSTKPKPRAFQAVARYNNQTVGRYHSWFWILCERTVQGPNLGKSLNALKLLTATANTQAFAPSAYLSKT